MKSRGKNYYLMIFVDIVLYIYFLFRFFSFGWFKCILFLFKNNMLYSFDCFIVRCCNMLLKFENG